MTPTRFAFVGFRHPHIRDMFQRCSQREDVEIVACCEEDSETRRQLAAEGDVRITHEACERMLAETECDVVAIGDCYGRRADLAVQALEAGRHIMSDKPLCVTLAELDRIERAADARGLVVGMMLDMRDLAPFLGLRALVQAGEIGEIRALRFDGQHPLMFGKRPAWYFEPGMHGGVLNDIAIHAVDMIPWATGLEIQSIEAARGWNGNLPQHPDFEQCGQAMLTLSNGAGVLCDVSYLAPDSFGYTFPWYWTFAVWGDNGVLQLGVNQPHITLMKNGETAPRQIELPEPHPGAYLQSFLQEIRGEHDGLHLSSRDARRATRTCLTLQQAADTGAAHVKL